MSFVANRARHVGTPRSPFEVYRLALHDRVRVPNGREGEVIGFYRRQDESVLVAFSPGESGEFLLPDVEPLS